MTEKNHSHDPCLGPPGATAATPGAACHLNKSAPGAAWGMQQLGYAAAASAGLSPSGPDGTLSRSDIARLVQMYLGNITAEVKSLGFPLDKLFTHLGGESRRLSHACHSGLLLECGWIFAAGSFGWLATPRALTLRPICRNDGG